jgi:hypothetical protein
MPTEAAFKRLGIDPKEYQEKKAQGLLLNAYKSMSGEVRHTYVAQPVKPRPRLLLVEKYRLTTYLGQYGAGRTVSTFSLLPGEKTVLSISSYRRSERTAIEASSVLDSYTKESAASFEEGLATENSTAESRQESFNYHAEAEASASWGMASGSASAGIAGSTASSREEFSKAVSTATTKNASSASAKRDVQINTSTTATEQTGEETSITRDIRNINVGRTLNFVFRQMNQEFITVLHLVDVRVAFFNGYRGSKEEVALPDLDRLLAKYVLEPARAKTKEAILAELRALRDWRDRPVSDFIEPFPEAQRPLWWRVKRDFTSVYEDETGNRITVPGLIVNVTKNVMRTDGVIVEALLGEAPALDAYSLALQEAKNRGQALDNRLRELEVAKAEAQLRILHDKDEAAARVFQMLYPPAPSAPAAAPADDET